MDEISTAHSGPKVDKPLPPNAANQTIDCQVDARQLACPLPLLKARQALAEMRAGQRLMLLATDPASRRDIPLFAEQCGHLLESAEERGNLFLYALIKGTGIKGTG